MECGICYNTVLEENFKVFDCKHSICKCCFSKLMSYTCPFCRKPIPSCFDQLLPSIDDDIFPFDDDIVPNVVNSRATRRNRRRRRTIILNNHPITPVVNISIEEINQIEHQISYNTTGNNDNNTSKESFSDKNKQIQRSKRNRWRNSLVHQQGNLMINF